jgi:hypothetical protein
MSLAPISPSPAGCERRFIGAAEALRPEPRSVVSRRGRRAAMATDRRRSGRVLFELPEDSSRTREPSLGCTSSTVSPAARSRWASRCPRPPAPSTLQVRSVQSAAHSTSLAACDADAGTRALPSGRSAASIATAVCDPFLAHTYEKGADAPADAGQLHALRQGQAAGLIEVHASRHDAGCRPPVAICGRGRWRRRG